LDETVEDKKRERCEKEDGKYGHHVQHWFVGDICGGVGGCGINRNGIFAFIM
jgi:hypothetical protein